MRIFDIVGIISVAAWLGIVGVFVFTVWNDDPRGLSLTDGVIDLREETTWMTVVQSAQEIGVLREDRTRLLDGWLIEVQGILELSFWGQTYALRFDSKTNLDEDLTLRSATGQIEVFDKLMRLTGYYRESDGAHRFEVTVDVDNASERFVVDLDRRPLLSSLAIPQMLASDDLAPNSFIEEEFFDPLTLSPTKIRMTYRGTEEITNFGETYEAHVFRQTVSDFHTTIHADSEGSIIRQVFPLQFAAARLPANVGALEFRNYRRRFDERDEEIPPFINAIDTGALLAMLGRVGSGQVGRFRLLSQEEEEEFSVPHEASREFALSNVPHDGTVQLESPRQRLVVFTGGQGWVKTEAQNVFWHAGQAPPNSEYSAGADPSTNDELAGLINALEARIDENTFGLTAGEVLALIERDCAENSEAVDCLILLADALALSGFAPQFVHGAIESDGQPLPRVWLAIYVDGQRLLEMDPLAAGGSVEENHLQLFIADLYQPDRLAELLDKIHFEIGFPHDRPRATTP